MITELEGGRILEVDQDQNVLWQYINRYDDSSVAEISEARVYPSSFFDLDNLSCRNRDALLATSSSF